MILSYDGTNYHGWQNQANAQSIQSIIETKLSLLLKMPITIIGASRTDKGVHALNQVAHFSMETEIDMGKIQYSMNCILPKDIRILSLEKVDLSFHARFNAQSKTYRYFMTLQEPSVFERFYVYHIRKRIDLSLMQEAVKHFLGTHNFLSFANESHRGCALTKPIKTVTDISLTQKNNLIVFEITADGFLYKMVRNIVGTLLDVAAKKIDPKDIPHLFEKKDRTKIPSPALASGLFLMKVYYKKETLEKLPELMPFNHLPSQVEDIH
jgi:tRNA pseudouridine38-40 synthase